MKDVATETLEDELAVLWGNMSAAMARFCALLVELEVAVGGPRGSCPSTTGSGGAAGSMRGRPGNTCGWPGH